MHFLLFLSTQPRVIGDVIVLLFMFIVWPQKHRKCALSAQQHNQAKQYRYSTCFRAFFFCFVFFVSFSLGCFVEFAFWRHTNHIHTYSRCVDSRSRSSKPRNALQSHRRCSVQLHQSIVSVIKLFYDHSEEKKLQRELNDRPPRIG